jgi:chromosome segregation ATPase
MVKPTLVKNGTPMKRVLALKKRKRWQTSPSNLLQARNSSPTSMSTPTLQLASWQKETRYILFNYDFINDDEEQLAMKNKMIKEFGLNGYNVITKLMEKLDKRKATLDAQEDLLILEKERNLELQELLSNKDEMLKVMTNEISFVKITIEDKEKEMANVKTSIVNLANEKDALESNLKVARTSTLHL